MLQLHLNGCYQMNLYHSLYPQLEALGLNRWSQQLQQTVPEKLASDNHGKMAVWQDALQVERRSLTVYEEVSSWS